MLKAAGVFEGVELQGTEFTPKDSYQIAVFKDHWKQPSSCSSANPSSSQPFCQLFGPCSYSISHSSFPSSFPDLTNP